MTENMVGTICLSCVAIVFLLVCMKNGGLGSVNMKKLFLISIAIVILMLSYGCTEQSKTFTYGGSMKIVLDPNQKLENVTWKVSETSSSLWILTSDRPDNVSPKKYTFKESSNFGLIEGTVYIQER
jgi:hypothetical protein